MNQLADLDQIWYADLNYVSQDLVRLWVPTMDINDLICINAEFEDMQMSTKWSSLMSILFKLLRFVGQAKSKILRVTTSYYLDQLA